MTALTLSVAQYFDATPAPVFPARIELESKTHLTHTSLHSAPHHKFECPAGEEGLNYERLEQIKALLVSNKSSFAPISRYYNLPSRLIASYSQAPMLRANPAVQADLFEAYVAQLAVEKGEDVARDWSRRVMAPLVEYCVDRMRADERLINRKVGKYGQKVSATSSATQQLLDSP